jgi:hypothetical protein
MTAMTKHNTGDVPQPTGNWPLDGCACQKSGGNGGNGESGYSLNCAIFAWRSQTRVPRRSELGPNPPGADAAAIPYPAFRFHPLAALIGREGFAPVHATLCDVAGNPPAAHIGFVVA